MNLKLDITEQDNILLMTVTGPYSLSDFKEVIALLQVECDRRSKNLALVDITRVEMEGTMPGLDRFIIGELLADLLAPRIKLAAVAQPQIVNRMAENVAVNRGMRMLVFFTREEAIHWLQGAPA